LTGRKDIKMMLATDWTYDIFMSDAEKYKATPQKGVHPSRNASDRERFMTWFKNCARDFIEEWMKSHNSLYDHGWIGDAFMKDFPEGFSDYYKDVYGQRPHLSTWFYLRATGLPSSEDTARLFCADPVGVATRLAKMNRESCF